MAMDMFDIRGKSVVITGGGGVLCKSMARELALRGANVAILDLREDAAKSAADEIAQAGGRAVGIGCNVLEKASLEEACSKVLAEYGGIDILINGAGGNNPRATTSRETCRAEDLKEAAEGLKTFFDLDPDGVQFVFSLNFIGTLLPSQVFGRVMVEPATG